MIFDQFSRYQACVDLIKQANYSHEKTILDVGSGVDCLLGKFLPEAQITYLDPLLAKELRHNQLTGDIFTPQLDNRSFDFVVAIDVFEHIPLKDRDAFLHRVSTLAKDAVILAFPTHDASEALKTDQAINDQYQDVFNESYPWLEEHFKFGLPSLADTIKKLEQLGWNYQTIGHGHAPWLEKLLGLVICLWDIPYLQEVVINLSEKFNQQLYPYDFRPPYYRNFILLSRTPINAVNIYSAVDSNIDPEAIFASLLSQAYQYILKTTVKYEQLHVQDIIRLQEKIEQTSNWGQALQATIRERDALITSLSTSIDKVSIWGQALQITVNDRDTQITQLNTKLEEITNWRQSLQATIIEKDKKIAVLNENITEVEQSLAELQQINVELQAENSKINQHIKHIDANLLPYAINKFSYTLATAILKVLPFKPRVKYRLSLFSLWVQRFWLSFKTSKTAQALDDVTHAIAVEILKVLPFKPRIKYRTRLIINKLEHWSNTPLVSPLDIDNVIGLPDSNDFNAALASIKDRDIFIFSVIDWHFRIQRPQQLAKGFAKAGRRVFFISNTFIDSNQSGYAIEQLDNVLPIYQVKLHVKDAPAIYFSAPSPATEKMLRMSIAQLIVDFAALSSISIIQHPFWYPLACKLPNTYRIYDCMDHHEGFGNVPEELVVIEKDMLSNSDLVVVTSAWLEVFAYEFNSNIFTIRNACEFEHFAHKPDTIFHDSKSRKIIGYYGAIAEWFDLDLIHAVALANAEHLILLVGSDTVGAIKQLKDLPNVLFTGEVPYDQLPFYLYAFDVCLLPFKIIPLTMATNPVKVYEYLSAGRPVISVDLPEIAQFGDLVCVARAPAEFNTMIQNVLGASVVDNYQQRQQFAQEQTWDHRVIELNEAVNKIQTPKVSVIVLTYNNLELTKNCLKSIIEESDYPNLELIIVDNASSDATPEYLCQFAVEHEYAKVILNEQNLGFAAGNNVGLAQASGEYLVLLNNDTVVTRGWILTLLRQLQTDKTLGLIGPVTNNIGNEARIETSYTDIAHMPVESFRYTLTHMGRIFPIKTVAFFCVMMPRSTYDKVGGLCEDYGRGFFEDDDYCRRVELQGLRIVCAEDVFVHHHLSASFNKLKDEERQKLFKMNKDIYEAKWGKWIPHAYRVVS